MEKPFLSLKGPILYISYFFSLIYKKIENVAKNIGRLKKSIGRLQKRKNNKGPFNDLYYIF